MALGIANSSRVNASSSSPNPDKGGCKPSRCVLPRPGEPSTNLPEQDTGPSTTPRQARHPENADEKVLSQRESGKTFAAIARSIGFERPGEAHVAFMRALNKREGDDRRSLIERESVRLDELETRIRTRDADDPPRMEGRLTALAKMREMLK